MRMQGCIALLFSALFAISSIAAISTGHSDGAAPAASRNSEPKNDLTYLNVNLTYPNGSPKEYQWVSVRNLKMDSGSSPSNVTDASGLTTIEVSSLTWGNCLVFSEDYTERRYGGKVLFIGPNEVINLSLVLEEYSSNVSTITGIVTNASSGEPVQGIGISAMGEDLDLRYFYHTNTTDPEGRYTISVPDSRSIYILSGPDWGDPHFEVSRMSIRPEPGVTEYDRDIKLNPKYEQKYPVSFRFLNSTTGKSAVSGYLSVRGYDAARDHVERYSIPFASSISPGGYANGSLPPGEFQIDWTLSIPEQNLTFTAQTYFLVNDTPVEMELPVEVPGTFRPVTLTVTDGSAPVVGASVSSETGLPDREYIAYSYAHTSTDSSGRASFGIPAGSEAKVSVSLFGYDEKKLTIPWEDDTSPLEVEVELFKRPTGALSLLVRDEVTGVILPGTQLQLSDRRGYYYGSYTISNDGYLNTTIEAQVYRSINAISPIGKGSLVDFEVKEGILTKAYLNLTRFSTQPERFYGSLMLKDAQGSPVAHQRLYISSNDPGVDIYENAISEGDGRVPLYLPPGNYSVGIYYATLADGSWRNLWAAYPNGFLFPEGGGEVQDITCYPTYPFTTISGFIRDGNTGAPIPAAFITGASRLYLNMTTYESVYLGNFNSGSTPEGYYRLNARDNISLNVQREGYFPKDIFMDVGSTGSMDLDIYLVPIPPRSAWVNGTLVDENDAPIKGHISIQDMDNMGFLGWFDVGADGKFAFHLYPGRFNINYYDDAYQISSTLTVTVNTSGIRDLVLKLVPRNDIQGIVSAMNGTPIAGASLMAECVSGFKAGEQSYAYTDEDGYFRFWSLYAGTYRITIEAGDLYDRFQSEPFVFDGRTLYIFNATLANRSTSDLWGYVYSSGGPFQYNIPNATLVLRDDQGDTASEAVSSENGYFWIKGIKFGTNYSLEASPPDGYGYIENVRSGYKTATVTGINLTQAQTSVYPTLEYIAIPGDEPLQVWSIMPQGTAVYTIAPITVTFSIPVDVSTFPSAFSVSPEIAEMTFEWNIDNTSVTVRHADFGYNITYQVTIGTSLTATNGNSLFDPYSWTFTTVKEDAGWLLYSAWAVLNNDRSLNVSAVGLPDLTVYIVINDIGSFQMLEGDDGEYNVVVPSSEFEWNTTYTYYFSNASGGMDIQPALGGTFTTPAGPGPDDDDDDDDDVVDDDDDTGLGAAGKAAICCGAVVLILLVLLIVVVLIIIIRRRQGQEEE